MPITVELARRIVRAAKDDDKLLGMLAGELAKAVDPDALATYLLGGGMVNQLLAQRLADQPDKTIADLERLARGGSSRRNGVRRAPAAKRASGAAAPKAKATGRGKGRRHRLTAAEVDGYKRAIIEYLGKNPAANRKAITEAVGLPTPSIYNRLIGELKSAGIVRSQGQKAKTVYSLTAGGARSTRKTARKTGPAKAKKKTTRKKAKAKTKA